MGVSSRGELPDGRRLLQQGNIKPDPGDNEGTLNTFLKEHRLSTDNIGSYTSIDIWGGPWIGDVTRINPDSKVAGMNIYVPVINGLG